MKFTAPGAPVPKERPRTFTTRSGKVRTITPTRTQAYEDMVAWFARAEGIDDSLWDSDVSVRMWFYMPDNRRRDVDNLAKSVLDSVSGLIFKDDTQVRHVEAWKLLDRQNPRTEVEVMEWTG